MAGLDNKLREAGHMDSVTKS